MTATTSGTVTLYGGNNITLSTGASKITISGPNVGGAQTGISGINDGAGTITSGTVSLVGNNLTWSVNGQTLSASVAASHAVQTGISSVQASDATYTSGKVIISGGNNITVSSGANQSINIHGPNSHAVQTGISGVQASNATYTSGTVIISGENNITVHSGANQSILLSGPATSAQQTGISGVQNSNATYTSGTIIISGGNNITVSSGANQSINIHGPNSHAQQTGISGIADAANTVVSGTLSLASANNITFTLNGQTLSGSVHAQQTGISSVAASNTTFTSGQIIISGGNNITVSSGANQSINIHGPNTSAQQTGISGLRDGAQTITSGTASFAAANGVTFSLNAQTISASVSTQPTLSQHWLWPNFGVNNPVANGMDQNVVRIAPLTMHNALTATRFNVYLSASISTSTNSSHAGSFTVQAGFYTRNVSTLSLASSGSATVAWTNTSNNSTASLSGFKVLSGAMNVNLTPGEYWFASAHSTASANANWYTMSHCMWVAQTVALSGSFGAANNATVQFAPGMGEYTATSAALPASIAFSQINGTAGQAHRHPMINLVNYTA